MKTRNIIFLSIALAFIIIAYMVGCSNGKKLVKPITKIVRVEICDTMYQTDTLKLVQTVKGKTVRIVDQKQLDSLRQYFANRLNYKQSQVDSILAIIEGLNSAGIGDEVVAAEDLFLMKGMAFTEEGDTLFWDVWVTDTTAIVAGTPDKPTPVFRVIQHEEIPIDVPTFADEPTFKPQRRNSLSFAVLTSYDGKTPTVIPLAKLQINKLGYMVGRDLANKMWMFGISTREIQFGKPK